MANVQRVRENAAVRSMASNVASATVIEIGDLVAALTTGAYPASSQTWQSNLATTQGNFHDVFLGVATAASASGATDDIRVVWAGAQVEFACSSATFKVGDLVGPADSGSSTLMDQTVVAVATADLAIGRVAKTYTTATTKVLVEIDSSLMSGGAQAVKTS